jgi:hypothetical protein
MVEKIKESSETFLEVLPKIKNINQWLMSTSSPTELIFLGSFPYLGRRLAFDSLGEYMGISEEVHLTFSMLFLSLAQLLNYSRIMSLLPMIVIRRQLRA